MSRAAAGGRRIARGGSPLTQMTTNFFRPAPGLGRIRALDIGRPGEVVRPVRRQPRQRHFRLPDRDAPLFRPAEKVRVAARILAE